MLCTKKLLFLSVHSLSCLFCSMALKFDDVPGILKSFSGAPRTLSPFPSPPPMSSSSEERSAANCWSHITPSEGRSPFSFIRLSNKTVTHPPAAYQSPPDIGPAPALSAGWLLYPPPRKGWRLWMDRAKGRKEPFRVRIFKKKEKVACFLLTHTAAFIGEML